MSRDAITHYTPWDHITPHCTSTPGPHNFLSTAMIGGKKENKNFFPPFISCIPALVHQFHFHVGRENISIKYPPITWVSNDILHPSYVIPYAFPFLQTFSSFFFTPIFLQQCYSIKYKVKEEMLTLRNFFLYFHPVGENQRGNLCKAYIYGYVGCRV